VISLNFILQTIPQFSNYSIYDSKIFFLKIQVSCAAAAFLISLIYIIIFLICRLKLHRRAIKDNPAVSLIPKRHDLRAAPALPVLHPDLLNALY
jgi:hypothetical protein